MPMLTKKLLTAATAESTLTENLIAWWDWSNGGNLGLDAHTNSLNLTNNGSVTQGLGPGALDAITLSGTGQYMDIAGNTLFNFVGKSFTLAAWWYRTTDSTTDVILQRGAAGPQRSIPYWLAISSADDPFFSIGNNSTFGSANISTIPSQSKDSWYCSIATYDLSTMDHDINDGAYTQSTGYTGGTYEAPVKRLAIGAAESGANAFAGRISTVAMWDRVLTSDEIAEFYNNGNGIAYPG